ncbi:MAG: NAD-reducing hydrogenase subunit HoxF [Candidatus Jettenia ecosi]|uniref:NAD-reducing hydrogenase subunit HoxF n=1 Tax=Candidatus Jettenia ecosi TaxID=2494326 RepID=A0A533QPP6_9BACT|nr:MAG: NAD-reducing hydrogenase subunit HoxF [Candidatus Jettenia ecosi]
MKKLESPDELVKFRKSLELKYRSDKIRVLICTTGCRALGAEEVFKAFKAEIKKLSLEDKVEIVDTGCQGLCARAPVLTIEPMGIFYGRVTEMDVTEIVSRTILKGEVIERLCYTDAGKRIPYVRDIPFYSKQEKIVLRNCGEIDPKNIHEYIVRDGYAALSKVLSDMTPEDVIHEMKSSGLRGRGGAGFPTGNKWEFVKKAAGDIKYIICNGDEGDPGAFMDRAVLEGDPHTVIEGMLIGAYAIGARKGIIYVRAEYPIAVEHLKIAIEQAKTLGLLGENILGSQFGLDLEIKMGAGAFVCGEETALIASIEGKRGMPRPRPPFPATNGLWGKPTNINNVETFANVPVIILKGSEFYKAIGTETSKGTKIFALAGNVKNTGLVEVPMGTTLREIVFDIGGGIPGRKKFKAAQMGGPSGGCVPAQHLDLSIDYETVKEVGAIMGSGGLIVMDDSASMVEIARYFMEFCQDESCGKCVPCRIGTKRMLDILTRITKGEGKKEDIDLLRELAEVTKTASLCGLGQTAANPVLSTIRYYINEYEELINKKSSQTSPQQSSAQQS